jgi:hypothetical protein
VIESTTIPLTAEVVAVNAAVLLPALTVTVAGSATAELLSDRVTTMPPLGAGAVNVTIPIEGIPAVTRDGLNETLESFATGVTMRLAVFVTLP